MTDLSKFAANLDCVFRVLFLGAGKIASRSDLLEILLRVDIALMTYDFYGPWSSTTGAHSALYTCNAGSYSIDQSVKDWTSWVSTARNLL